MDIYKKLDQHLQETGKVHLVTLFIGVNLTFFFSYFLGSHGMPRIISD